MHTQRLLLFGLLLFASGAAQAQITISEADLRGQIVASFVSTNYIATDPASLQALAGLSGGNQTYDFRIATYTQEEVSTSEVVSCSSSVPGCDDPDFGTANVVMRSTVSNTPDSTAYFFGRLQADGFYSLGTTAEGDFDPSQPGLERVALKFAPALLSQRLPLTMGTEWDTDVMVSVSQGNVGIDFSYRSIDENEVDGWGTLQTPSGSAPALRLWNRNISTFDFGGIVFTDTTYALTFITRGTLSATLGLDAQGQVMDAGYTVLEPGTANERDPELPSRIALSSNYPNPFNPSTTITYTLGSSGPVRLAVYDLLGRELEVLVDGLRAAGTYQVVWDAGTRPSGAYLYRLTAGDGSVSRLMTLLK